LSPKLSGLYLQFCFHFGCSDLQRTYPAYGCRVRYKLLPIIHATRLRLGKRKLGKATRRIGRKGPAKITFAGEVCCRIFLLVVLHPSLSPFSSQQPADHPVASMKQVPLWYSPLPLYRSTAAARAHATIAPSSRAPSYIELEKYCL
jgi:hypothetical protein